MPSMPAFNVSNTKPTFTEISYTNFGHSQTINPIIRGWGNYYCRSHVRKRFHQLDGWIIRRLWSHRTKRWRNAAWKVYPTKRLRTEFKLVSLVSLIPSLRPFMKAGYGKTVCPVCAADGGKLFIGRLLRPDSCEADELSRATGCGVGGAKGGGRGECESAKHGTGTAPGDSMPSQPTNAFVTSLIRGAAELKIIPH
jgi:hypothetical protein